jgi:hypothetical protein
MRSSQALVGAFPLRPTLVHLGRLGVHGERCCFDHERARACHERSVLLDGGAARARLGSSLGLRSAAVSAGSVSLEELLSAEWVSAVNG